MHRCLTCKDWRAACALPARSAKAWFNRQRHPWWSTGLYIARAWVVLVAWSGIALVIGAGLYLLRRDRR
ncbi:MAG: hypothetical protein ACRC2B_08765 [Rubrivivax sp.]